MLFCNADILSPNKLSQESGENDAILFISNGREQAEFGLVSIKT